MLISLYAAHGDIYVTYKRMVYHHFALHQISLFYILSSNWQP